RFCHSCFNPFGHSLKMNDAGERLNMLELVEVLSLRVLCCQIERTTHSNMTGSHVRAITPIPMCRCGTAITTSTPDSNSESTATTAKPVTVAHPRPVLTGKGNLSMALCHSLHPPVLEYYPLARPAPVKYMEPFVK
ncbi:unnamed protein product, partial [Ectocarpus sp. 12 AP-2014]